MKTIQLLLFLFFTNALASQKVIEFRNPSFEDISRCCKPARGWEPCGKEDLNPPDVQPGHFNVYLEPFDGNTYLGMVTRDNESWEAVSQRINYPIRKGNNYWFSIEYPWVWL